MTVYPTVIERARSNSLRILLIDGRAGARPVGKTTVPGAKVLGLLDDVTLPAGDSRWWVMGLFGGPDVQRLSCG